MHTAELLFKTRARRQVTEEEAFETILRLLIAYTRNGQIAPNTTHPIAAVQGAYRVFVSIPEATSLRPSVHSKRVREVLKWASEMGLRPPTVKVLGREPDSAPVCQCRRRKAMVLKTDFLTTEFPLRCGDCEGHIPFYRFKHTNSAGTYEDILAWEHAYRAYDALWMWSGAGEALAHRELSRHDSELSKQGRDVCRRIEKRTRVPVYYYLMRYYGRSLPAELKSRCPNCGKAWHLKHAWHDFFDFRCDRCRLVSSVAAEVHWEEHAETQAGRGEAARTRVKKTRRRGDAATRGEEDLATR